VGASFIYQTDFCLIHIFLCDSMSIIYLIQHFLNSYKLWSVLGLSVCL